jgi:ATP-dependent helicase/nuclease subunit A
MSASATKWTEAQSAGITTVGRSLLVSAAAGSGKTAVLAERCAHLVCAEKDGCGVDELLVVTFTESAAAEMKARIQAALRRRFEQNPSKRLARQVSLSEHAQVSTVHGFCYRLLRQNFTLAGIDPKFQVLDPDEAALLRREIATDLFHCRYEEDQQGDFQRLVDAYGNGDDEKLIDQVIWIHALLASLLDPRRWIENSLLSIREAAESRLEESQLGRKLIRRVDDGLSNLARSADEAIQSLGKLGRDFDPYIEYLKRLTPFFSHWKQVLDSDGLNMLIGEIADFRENIPRMPSVRGQPAGKDLAKSLVDGVKDAVKTGPLSELLKSKAADWQAGLRRIEPFAHTLLSLVSEFSEKYSEAKAGQRVVDFADLERLSLKILREGDSNPPRPSALARALHGQFRHVLVDEYQDINPIQDAILRLISRESLSENNANLFCVGDVKQSIFRFRLAEPARFLDRHERFSRATDQRAGKLIHLRENFRSRAPLLNAINGVFERLMTRDAAEIEYDQSHRLAAGAIYPSDRSAQTFAGAPIELHLLPRDPGNAEGLDPLPKSEQLDRVDYEAILVARRIRQMLGRDGSPPMNVYAADASGQKQFRPIEPQDIVVLLRAMRHKADRFAEVIHAHGIDVHNEAAAGLFDTTEIRDVLCLLQILDNQRQDIPLAAVLRSPLGKLPEADDSLARIRLAYPQQEESIPFHEAARRYAIEKNDKLAAFLRDFFTRLHRWRDRANKRPVAELLWELYEETGYLAFCGGLPEGEERMANLLELHDRAAQFGGFLRQGLYRFLRFLDGLRNEDGLGRPAAVGKGTKAVRIMSIHRSKGLEFPVVFLPDLDKEINLSDTYGAILVDRQMGLGMDVVEQDRLIRYPSLSSVLVSRNLHRQTMAEELRLLYVAMTRAKEHLVLVATCSESDREKWKTQWENRPGAVPADVVQSAQRVIDWLGPVAAMTSRAASPIFQVREHPAEEVRAWKNPRDHRPEFTDHQKRLARLEPLAVDPAMTNGAKRVIARFQAKYLFEPFTRVRATASVTSLAKANAGTVAADSIPQRKLDLPLFFQRDAAPKATDIGNATHALLQYFDFAGSPTAPEIERQISFLVEKEFLPVEYANLVDRGAVLWFLNSELGTMLRANQTALMREVPFAMMQPSPDCPPTSDLADQIMIRGRIDLLVPGPAGVSIVDYKTDKVTGQELDQRVETYSRQMRFYADAIRTVARSEIAAIYLVFLSPRKIVRV